MRQVVSILLTVLLLAGAAMEWWRRPVSVDPEPYHRRVAAAISQMRLAEGGWEGSPAGVPPAAIMLLKPNILRCVAYHHPSSGRHATLVLVQCRDARDMNGHFPPTCYPAHGWEADGLDRLVTVSVGGVEVPMTRYQYAKSVGERRRTKVVYGCFVLPETGIVAEMEVVRRSASDYRTRDLGAAQVQVLLDEAMSDDQERAIVADLLGPAMPAIDEIRLGAAGAPK